jgi:hypothetical protein
MKKLFLFSMFFALISAVTMTSCKKESNEVQDFSTLKLEEVDAAKINQDEIAKLCDKLYALQEDGTLTEEEIASVGNPKTNYEMAIALKIAEKFKPTINSTNPSNGLELRGTSTIYRWTGKTAKKYYIFGCIQYEALYGSTFGYSCATLPIISQGSQWVSRTTITCNRPAAGTNDCN